MYDEDFGRSDILDCSMTMSFLPGGRPRCCRKKDGSNAGTESPYGLAK